MSEEEIATCLRRANEIESKLEETKEAGQQEDYYIYEKAVVRPKHELLK